MNLHDPNDSAYALFQEVIGAPRLTPIPLSGKHALSNAFGKATDLGATHLILMADEPSQPLQDPALLLAASAENPIALILGYRPVARQSFSTRLSNLLLRLETGACVHDSRARSRVYPLRLIKTIDPDHNRHFTEQEFLAWAAWVGCPIVDVALPTSGDILQLPQNRLARWLHALREFHTHIRLLLRELSGLSFPKYQGGVSMKPFWRSIWQWCNPIRAWRELRRGGATQEEMAVGFGVGVFIANIPAYGFQTFIALYAARRLHLNPVAVVAGSQAAIPPIGPACIAAAVWLGHLMRHGTRLTLAEINPLHGRFFAHGGPLLLDWIIGSVPIGILAAVIGYFAASSIFRLIEQRNPHEEAHTARAKTEPAIPPSDAPNAQPPASICRPGALSSANDS